MPTSPWLYNGEFSDFSGAQIRGPDKVGDLLARFRNRS